MSPVIDRDYKHELDEDTFTLVSSGIAGNGQRVKLTNKWRDEETMSRNLENAIASGEKVIAEYGNAPENDPDTVYAGKAAENAKSSIQRFPLLFGYSAFVGKFDNHEYDEGALMVGFLKITVHLKLTGEIEWKTLKISTHKKFSFGIGGASWARFVSFKREKKS